MKGNIKKLALFVMIAAITMFTAVPMASAFDHGWGGIQGEYAMMADTMTSPRRGLFEGKRLMEVKGTLIP